MKTCPTIDTATILVVNAEVRYWEDAIVNGVEDTGGTLIPFRKGNSWEPKIDITTGKIIDWPNGTIADIHYKVCDSGQYRLIDSNGNRWKWNDYYVPDELLCVGDRGYGDYIIFKVDASGTIVGWKKPKTNPDEWTLIYSGSESKNSS